MITFTQAHNMLKKIEKQNKDREIKSFLKQWKSGKVSEGSPYWLEYYQYIKSNN